MNKLFPIMLFCVSILIAGTAAYFSVKGIGLLFAGSFLPVVVMASSLEIGKLFAVSFLYRKWYDMPRALKTYLSIAVLLLVLITSLGIFGFLSDAYQGTRDKVAFYNTKIESLETHNITLNKQITSTQQTNQTNQQTNQGSVDRYKQIYDDFVAQQNNTKQALQSQLQGLDDAMSQLKSKPGGLFSNKTKQIEQLKAEQQTARVEINEQLKTIESNIKSEYDKFLSKVDQASVDVFETVDTAPMLRQIEQNNQLILDHKQSISNTDIGSFKFIAQTFGIQVDTAVKWFIIMIVVVFDPLAMCLVIGYNVYVHGSASHRHKSVIPTQMRQTGVVIKPVKK